MKNVVVLLVRCWRRPRRLQRPPGLRSARDPLAVALQRAPAIDDAERPLGCGWFDSSHELLRGLWVREHDGAAGFPSGAMRLPWSATPPPG